MFYKYIVCFGFVSIVNSNSLYLQQIVPKDPHYLSEHLSQSMNAVPIVQETESETGKNIKDFYLENRNQLVLYLDRFGEQIDEAHRQKLNRNSGIENNKKVYVSKKTDANINKQSDNKQMENTYEDFEDQGSNVQPYYQSQILSPAAYHQHGPSDIEVLNSLIGKAPNAQIQGLNRLLLHPAVSEDQVNNGPSISQSQQTNPYQIKVKLFDVDKQNRDDKNENNNLHYAAQYAFGYKVSDIHSGSHFGHHETRNDDITKGYYHVVLPDGRLQNVQYWVDKTGYHAQVKYTVINR